MRIEFDDNAVTYDIEVLPEYIDVRGNAMASGDDDFDKQCEDEILADLADGNEWAWCTVRVTARYDGIDNIVGSDLLGGCSYKDEADFVAGGYYEDMCDCAREELYAQLEGILARFGCLNPADNPECIEGNDRGE